MDRAQRVDEVTEIAEWNSWPEKSRQVPIAGAPLDPRDSRGDVSGYAGQGQGLLG
jgi:hypothetical protein